MMKTEVMEEERETVSVLEPEYCVYSLDKVFNLVMAERDRTAQDLTAAHMAGDQAAAAELSSLYDVRTDARILLQAFKDAGMTHIATAQRLEAGTAENGVNTSLSRQIKSGGVRPMMLDKPFKPFNT